MKLNDEQLAAFKKAIEQWTIDEPGSYGRFCFAAGIAHAQAWRPIASAPAGQWILVGGKTPRTGAGMLVGIHHGDFDWVSADDGWGGVYHADPLAPPAARTGGGEMMTPEQQQAFRTRIQSDAISGVALDRIVAAVDDMLAAERAAERAICRDADLHCIGYPKCNGDMVGECHTDACYDAAAIRAQGGGK